MPDEVLEVVFDFVEDVGVWPEVYGGAVDLCLPLIDQFGLGDAPDVFLGVAVPLPVDLGPKVLGQGVYHGRADSVESARHLVGAAAELAAGVERGHDGF